MLLYDKIARWYDFLATPFEWPIEKKSIDTLDTSFLPKYILDIGCGTGKSTLYLAQKFPQSHVIGVDISSGMINIAKRKSSSFSNIELIQKDIFNCSFNKKFDLIYMAFFFELLERKQQETLIQKHIPDWLSKNGHLLNLSLEKGKNLGTQIYTWFHKKFPQWIDCRPIDFLAYIDSKKWKILNKKDFSLFGIKVSSTLITQNF